MSTQADRASRATRLILPLKFEVRQEDGSFRTQVVDVKVRVPKPNCRKTKREHALRDELES